MTQPFLIHNHSDYSNLRLRDATNRVEDILEYALELGLPGIALTDHETLSGHVKVERYINDNYDRFKDFKVGYGNEIYLVDKDEVKEKQENNESIQFFHFLLLAKNQRGYEFLRKQTTRAWENSFWYRGMQRVVTYYDELKEMIKGYEDDVIVSSACIGSNLNQLILQYNENKTDDLKRQIHENIMYFINLVGKDNFYLELQPAINHDKTNVENKKEQQIVNDMLLTLAKAYGLTPIITTDAHYLNREQAKAHEIYLKSSNGEREVAAFYETTYIMDRNELLEYFDEDLLDTLINNTHGIMDKLEPITFKNDTQVPNIDIPKYDNNELFENYLNEYEYINKYYNSNREMDRYYLHLIGEGMKQHNQEFNNINLSRIDVELEQVWKISEKLKQPLSSYFVLTQDIVAMMWEVSLVGVSRGSASCFYTNYLLDIVQINAIDYDLPYWR
ncbi:DNA polymerase [Staphylococcus phage SpP]